MEDRLELRYIPLSQARKWEANPKLHDFDSLERSIVTHGFGDPPKFDSTLNALVYGNGRAEVLVRLRDSGKKPPRGIAVLDNGEWAVPVIFGVDSKSRDAAVAFAIDHNNLTLLGGGLGLTDILSIWDEEELRCVLEEAPGSRDLLASLDESAIYSILDGPDFDPVSAEDQSSLDQKKLIQCPECGCEFHPGS